MSSTPAYYSSRHVLPVVHHLDIATSIAQARLAMQLGARGVFLISHKGKDIELEVPAVALKNEFPDRLIGLNLLSRTALDTLLTVKRLGLDMAWVDAPGVTSAGWTEAGAEVVTELKRTPSPLLFGSVAFKYQPHDPWPEQAARACAGGGMLPTTSGAGTGKAPDVEKARRMSEALAGGPLAVASGMTPENVEPFLPYFTHYLVATGVSRDEYRFDEARLQAFIEKVQG